MIGSLIGFADKDPLDKVMSVFSSGVYVARSRGITSVIVLVHPDTMSVYMERYHQKVIDDFSSILEFSGVQSWDKLPRGHVMLADKESVKK